MSLSQSEITHFIVVLIIKYLFIQFIQSESLMRIAALIFIVILFWRVQSVDEGDWVDTFDLPIGFLAHPFYAGYLNITSTQAFYYTYFPSQNNPGKDPLIVRISAGPGCSALYSAFYSKGPFVFVRNTKNFRVNPYNWNKQANLLFLEGPGNIGFSKGDSAEYNDQSASALYYLALEKFYQKFPQLKDQTVYLSGQQYAGVIVPRIAQTIVELNRDSTTPAWQKIKLGGFILNNPCTLGDQCDSHKDFTKYTMKYLKNHYFISEQVYQQYTSHCTLQTPECERIKQSIQSSFLNTGSDLANLYTECIQQASEIRCMDLIGITSFLNDPNVKKDMHADESITWKQCNADLQQKWIRNPDGALKIYEKLLRQESDLRIWILTGQLSGSVPIIGTKMWFQELKHNLGLSTTRMWEPWFFNHTINAGDIQQVRGMSLVTVRAGGYNLWNDQPQIGYHIIDSFLKGVNL